ncbi:MAG: glycosyltransferase [Termitinemataceae bacterium]|nr:MAG: glycosyltransferase [Termitinemataceae bacterium]
METKYSVLMPLWYKEKPEFLKASIESMTKQTMPPAEFVLVRDHEIPHDLLNVIEESTADIPVKYIDAYELFGQGLGAILARGVENCSYELIARMDSDDIAFPDRCEKQLKVFMENPQLAIVGGTIAEFSDTIEQIISYRVLPENHNDIVRFAKLRCPFNHPTVMYRKEVILEIGNYHVLSRCEDYDLWFRILCAGREGFNIANPILYYRGGLSMLKRRDSLYIHQYILLKKRMKEASFINWIQFIISVYIQQFSYYLPYFIQKIIYMYLLRKKLN